MRCRKKCMYFNVNSLVFLRSQMSATMRLFSSVSEALPSHAPGPVCWRLDGILWERTLEDRSSLLGLGDWSSHGDNTEHHQYQAQDSHHLN